MRRFELIDSERDGAVPCGVISYDPTDQTFSARVFDWATPRDVPAIFIPFVERGERDIPPRWVRAWVDERIAPPTRQNIGQILRVHDLEEYEPCVLLMSGEGRSSQDGFYLREIADDDQS